MEYDNILKYGKDITWSLPLFYGFEPSYGAIFKFFKNVLNIELPHVNIYGSPFCLWTGGRVPCDRDTSILKVMKRIDYIKSLNATPVFTFTNTLLTEKHLYDTFCNRLLDIGVRYNAKFIVSSDLLRDYIKNKYPNAFVVASIIKIAYEFEDKYNPENETIYYNNLMKDYDTIVVNHYYAKDYLLDYADKIDDVSKIEVLVNSYCSRNCAFVKKHSNLISKIVLEEINELPVNFCPNKTPFSPLSISEEQIKKLIELNIRHFKLLGRDDGFSYESMLFLLEKNMFNLNIAEYYKIFDLILFECLTNEISYFNKHILN